AYYLSLHFRVPIVLEYRDEGTESPFSFVSIGNVDRAWEKRSLRRARRVIFTTQSQLEHSVAQFPCGHRERSVVIANGWEPDDFSAAEPRGGAAHHNSESVVSFVGNLGD